MSTLPEEKTAVRGLEGVVAAETSVSYVDGIHGRLLYQGYDIHDIAENMTFAETVWLLWRGRLPTPPSATRSGPRWWPKCDCPARWWRCYG